ncbi:hypothetical protein Tco_0525802 [Tanacetum coccineum]
MHKVQNNNDNYNVFAIENEHPEQPESSNDIYLTEQGDSNITIDSSDICYDSKNRNKFLELSNKELVDKLKGEIEDFKTKNKSLESSNNHFKEANNKLSKTNQLMFKDLKKFQAELDKYNDVNYASKVEIDCAKAKGDLIFAKPEFLKKAQRANPRLYDIGCYNDNLALMLARESEKMIRLDKESRLKLSDLIRLFDYDQLNNLYDLFVPQREKSPEQHYFPRTSKMSHTSSNNEFSKESFRKQTTLLEKRMDESIPWDQKHSQISTGNSKTQFLNEIDRLLREYYYADHMNAILGVYTDLDEVTNLQCDYLETLEKCEHLEKELSKSRTMSKSFEALQKHAINLELDLQQCKEKIKNDKSFKENQSNVFLKEREQYFEIQDLKAQLQDKGIAISELKKLIEKMKGKSVETKFEKSLVIPQPNAFKSQRQSILGKPSIFFDSLAKTDFSKSKSVTTQNMSHDFSKPVTTHILPQNVKSILKNTNVITLGMKIHTDDNLFGLLEMSLEREEIIDGTEELKLHSLCSHHISPVVSTTFVEQFWMIAKSKLFNNVREKNSGNATPLFDYMLVQPTEDKGDTLEIQYEPQPLPSPRHLSADQHETQTDPSPRPSPTTHIPDSIPEGSGGNHGGQSSSDRSLLGNEGGMTLQSMYDLCISLCTQVIDQAKEIKHLKAHIKKLKKKAKPVITHHRAWMKSGRKSAKAKPTVHKDPAFDELDDDCMHEEKESAEKEVSTEDALGTDKQKVSTDKEEVSIDRPDKGTDKQKVSTDKEEVSTDRPE